MDEQNDLPVVENQDETSNESYSQYYGTPQDVISRYSHCAMCGAHLHFTHSTDFSRNLTLETSKCPECGIRIRRVMHKLQ